MPLLVHGRLSDWAVKPVTTTLYRKAVNQFMEYMNDTNTQPQSPLQLDEILGDYIQHLCQTNGTFTLASHTVHGLAHFMPQLRGQLSVSKRQLLGWSRLQDSTPRVPFTWEVTVCVSVVLAKSGLWDSAVATLLAFDCYLRIGEFCKLKVRDVAMPGDPRLGVAYSRACLRLANTKTGKNQSVVIRDSQVMRLLALHIAGKRPYELVFHLTPVAYNKALRQACVALGLGGIPYTAHCLRHGGATRDYLSDVPLEDIIFRGRWKSTDSARTYIKAGHSLLLTAQIPLELSLRGARLAGDLVSHLSRLRSGTS